MTQPWSQCSNCKKPIHHNTVYYVCSVSTCNRARTGMVFCQVDCWDAHLPLMRHKQAWAEEQRSPASGARATDEPTARRPASEPRSQSAGPAASPARPLVQVRRAGSDAPATARHTDATRDQGDSGGDSANAGSDDEVLVVASKVKAYIRERSRLSTSASVMTALSKKIRQLCDEAIRSAQTHERKTVLDRDVPSRAG